MRASHVIKRDTFHCSWSRDLEPVLRVSPGDTILCQLNDVSGSQLHKDSTLEDYTSLDNVESRSRFYPLAGPIYVAGASPGDTLVVHIESMKVENWGWSGFRPNLPPMNEIDNYYFTVWDLSNGKYANFKNGIKIPLKPFPGTIGVAPKEHGSFPIEPPYESNAGNLDVRYLTAGSKVMLPVLVEGALFSVGDPHAAQGDGELGSALESPAEIVVKLELEKGKTIPSAQYIASSVTEIRDPYFGTTGTSPDLMEAVRLATRHMIEYFTTKYHLSQSEAFVLCGLVGDLRIHQVVNPPNWTVGLMIPMGIFS